MDADAEREGLARGRRVGVDGGRRGDAVNRRGVAVGDAGAGLDGGDADLAGEVEAGGSALGGAGAAGVVGEVEGVAETGVEAGRDGGERSAEVDGAGGAKVDGAAGGGAREVAGAGVAGGAGGAAVISTALGAEGRVELLGDGPGELACDEALHERHDGADDTADETAADADVERVGADDKLISRYRDGDLLTRRCAHVELDDRAHRERIGREVDRAGRTDDAQREAVAEAEADVGDNLVGGAALNVYLGGVDADLELTALRSVVADVASLTADGGVADNGDGHRRGRDAEGDAARGAGGRAAGAAEETAGQRADVVAKEVEAALGHVDLGALRNLRGVVGVDEDGCVRVDGRTAATTAAATAAATTSAATAAAAGAGIHRSHHKEQQELTTDRTRDQSTHSSSNINEAQWPAPKFPTNLFNSPPWGRRCQGESPKLGGTSLREVAVFMTQRGSDSRGVKRSRGSRTSGRTLPARPSRPRRTATARGWPPGPPCRRQSCGCRPCAPG